MYFENILSLTLSFPGTSTIFIGVEFYQEGRKREREREVEEEERGE